MIVRIISKKFDILAIFIISLLLCIRITCIDPIDDNNRNDKNDQTIIDEYSSQLNDNISSDTNSESTSIIENDVLTISVEDKSDASDEVFSSTNSLFIADNQVNDDQPTTTATPLVTKKNLSNINSFEEWKQQQLYADLIKKGKATDQNSVASETSSPGSSKGGTSTSTNGQPVVSNGGSPKKGKLRKNFASASCGAKILAHNVEAQNVPSILSSSPDEYMLNPCNAKIWFVIELCESIRIFNIEIANFELFSSVPKSFRVSASDRYSTKDWHRHHLGTFNASFNRTIQSFQTLESTTYLKYVKFELLDFHGHEHYCPLSVVRIHGSNVEDELITMEENTNLVDSNSFTNIQDGTQDDDDDDDNDLSNEQQVGGIIGSAIIDLAKRVFRRQTIRGTISTTSIPITTTNELKTDCHQSVFNNSATNDSIKLWRQSDTFKQCIAEFLEGLWVNFTTCTIYLSHICLKSNYCCQCPSTIINNKTNRIKSTLNIYINPCGYYHILTNHLVCEKEKLNNVNKTIPTNLNSESTEDSSEKNVTIEKNDTVTIVNESTNVSANQSELNLSNLSSSVNQIPTIIDRTVEQTFANNISDETPVVVESEIPADITNETSFQPSTIESTNIDFESVESTVDPNTIDEIAAATPSTLTNHEAMPPLISSTWLKGMLINTKSLPELFKVIEKLNFNLTLSNRYLQELSQHYVKKLDETQQTTDLLLKASKSANEKLQNLEEHFYKLQEDFNDISYRLIKLEAWIPFIVFIMFCLIIWSIWLTCRISRLRNKLNRITDEYIKIKTVKVIDDEEEEEDNNDDDNPPIICNGLSKRKLSTDSSDSNPTRSQRVPDDPPLTKIKENGVEKIEHKNKGKPSNQTRHLLTLSTI
ncbi:unnamed protein product [Adineta steineri]|uniref:SUN domain-containing protein n=1 Tax=Adineta steineri TaxID=433720 RepID=A0A815TZD4_9BILA|nr:unnamed protein product [Adineta steineri]CAF1515121.1 unnamed protein product [Adineta steineri]